MILPRRHTLLVKDQLISVVECVPEESPRGTILILHGWRSEAGVWGAFMERLCAQGYRCIAPDLPGFGLSEMPRRDFTLDLYADTVLGLLKKMKVEECVVIGHSFGARVAIKLALRNTEEIKALILMGAAGITLDKGRLQSIGAIARVVKPLFAPNFMQPLRRSMYSLIGSEDYLAVPELKGTIQNIFAEDLESHLATLSLPTLLVWGANDDMTPLKAARTMNTHIHGSELQVFNQAGHYAFLDQADEVLETVINFLIRAFAENESR